MKTYTDRELLELAAKATGRAVEGYSEKHGLLVTVRDGVNAWWNPRTTDGDCARMEAELSICVMWESQRVEVFHFDNGYRAESFEDHDGDRNAARRAASVRMAAAIGGAMP